MRLFGLEITRTKAAAVPSQPGSSNWLNYGSWWPVVRESFPGAWQRNMELRPENVLAYSAVYSCITLIANDVAKCQMRLLELDRGVWVETENPAYTPVLRKPNRYQTAIKFYQQWVISKLIHGNTYVLKERDQRGVVVALYILDPCVTKPNVAPDGSIFYSIGVDNLTGITESGLQIPSSEIIHDTMVPLYHPLCGVSPLSACGIAAIQGLSIQRNSTRFFSEGSQPGGILTAPGRLSDDHARRLKEAWENNYSGTNAGKVAVLGDGLKFERMSINPVDAELVDQLKWTAEQVCTAFHVPPYMIGIGPMPTYNNIEALTQQYYGQCLQIQFESIEACLDEGMRLPNDIGVGFNLADLLRMDTPTKVKAATDGERGGLYSPNEARRMFDLPPVEGGENVMMQQQMWPIATLAQRDASALDPGGSSSPAPAADNADQADNEGTDESAREFAAEILARAVEIADRPAA